MRKRVVSLAMAAAMALSLTACGSSSSKTETTAAATEAAKTETTAAAEGAATEAAASGVDTSAWKDKTVTCIVPYDAGGGTDTCNRLILPVGYIHAGTVSLFALCICIFSSFRLLDSCRCLCCGRITAACGEGCRHCCGEGQA